MSTPDTEWTEAPEEVRSKCRAICGENDKGVDGERVYIYNQVEIDTATDIAYQAGLTSQRASDVRRLEGKAVWASQCYNIKVVPMSTIIALLKDNK